MIGSNYLRRISQQSKRNFIIAVYQNGATSGYTQSNSTAAALMSASGGPAGVVNHGGTTTSFNGSSSVNQHQPFNTSSSIGGSLSANCGGGQLGTFIAGQQGIGLHSVGNCFSYVNSKDNVEKNQSDKEKS